MSRSIFGGARLTHTGVCSLPADRVGQSFVEDREKLRDAKFDIAAMTAAIPQLRAGGNVVHFPRAGFLVTPAE